MIGEEGKVNAAAGVLQYDFRTPPFASWDPSTAPVAVMPIDSILVEPNQPAELDDIAGLTESIREHGVIEPLIVTPDGRLLSGRRRIVAAKRAGLDAVPVRVRDTADERATILVGLAVNVERRAPNPMTLAESYRALVELGSTVEEVARMVGQDAGHVYQHLALLDLHADVKWALGDGHISFASAQLLLRLEPTDQTNVLREIQESPKRLSTRQVKAKVEARRVMSMVRKTQREASADDSPNGDYASLIESFDSNADKHADESEKSPLDQLNAVIAEMLTVADREDEIRRWARRLSRILEALRKTRPSTRKEIEEKDAEQVQLF